MLAKVRRVVEFAHVAAGGVLHMTPWHGSPWHTPPEQPFAHVVVCGAYEQVPPLQVPGTTKPLRTLPVQVAAGGVLHVTLAQGSALQVPLAALQPKGHVCVLDEYVQLPPEQVPGDVDEVRTLPLHDGGGGVLHEMPVQGSGRHAPPLQPNGHMVSTGV